MGFEPFVPPKRIEKTEGTRDQKVESLAKLLHSRGLTSSMADARRLAEGMVDVEKKVMKAPIVSSTPPPVASKADLPDTAAHVQKQSAFALNLSEAFEHFVAQAATLSHKEVRQSVEINAVARGHIAFGREQAKPIAEVPHFHAHKQVFFEDAPPISQARGFKGPTPAEVDFPSQREEAIRRISQPQERPAIPAAPSAPTEPAPMVATKVEATESAVKVTRTEVTPRTEVVEERMIIEEPENTAEEPQVAPERAPEPASEAARAESEEQLVEKTQELPVTKSDAPREDLAKKHGVDLFEMFKKKT